MIWSLKRLETVSSPAGVGGASYHHKEEEAELIIVIITRRRRRRGSCSRAELKQLKLQFHSAYQWSEAHITNLQGSLAYMDWDIFRVDSLKERVEAITDYIKFL